MSKLFRFLAFLVAICCLTWVCVLWWWQRTDRVIEIQDVVIYLGLLPLALMLVLLGLRWAWTAAGVRQASLAGVSAGAGAGGSVSAGAQPTGADSRDGVDAQARHTAVQLVQAAMLCTTGEQASDLLEAAAANKPLPQPDADLSHDTGLPVMCARILDEALQTETTRAMLTAKEKK